MDRQTLIKEQQLSERTNLSLAIERGAVHLTERVILDAINFGDDAGHFPVEVGRHPSVEIFARACRGWPGRRGTQSTESTRH